MSTACIAYPQMTKCRGSPTKPHLRIISSTLSTESANLSLWPYPYQAGGHSQMLLANGGRVCKPFNRRENEFYKAVQNSPLLPFVPRYFGSIEVRRELDQLADDDGSSPSSSDEEMYNEIMEIDTVAPTPYVVLEDLTHKYRHPCVMDIKMGTAVRGAQCRETTSTTIGIRLCGMKVYHIDIEAFETKDRLFGRQLDVFSISAAMLLFLFNGKEVRYDLIPQFVAKLQALLKVLRKYKPWNFFSSSILFLYDGDTTVDPKVNIKMIDFAHVFPSATAPESQTPSLKSSGNSKPYSQEDDGYLFGLKNLIRYWKQLMTQPMPLELMTNTHDSDSVITN